MRLWLILKAVKFVVNLVILTVIIGVILHLVNHHGEDPNPPQYVTAQELAEVKRLAETAKPKDYVTSTELTKVVEAAKPKDYVTSKELTKVVEAAKPKDYVTSKELNAVKGTAEAAKRSIDQKNLLSQEPAQCPNVTALENRVKDLEKWREDAKASDEAFSKELDKTLDRIKKLGDRVPEVKSTPPPEDQGTEDQAAPRDWVTTYNEARRIGHDRDKPVFIAFHKNRDECPKCYAVYQNVYMKSFVGDELFNEFVCCWPSSKDFRLQSAFNIPDFPRCVVVDRDGYKHEFIPSTNPDVFLSQVRRYER